MKKCTFFSFCGLMIISTLLFSVNSYAVEQKLDIKSNKTGIINFIFPNLMPFIKIIDGQKYAAIQPITCQFTTKYTRKVNLLIASGNNNKEIQQEITASTPFNYTFQGYYFYSQIQSSYSQIHNFGCNSGTDGDECIEAKQQNIDNLIVNCY